MEKRTPGFLSPENIDHDSEQFQYIAELHGYLWRFVRCEIRGASGDLSSYIDSALARSEGRAEFRRAEDKLRKMYNLDH